MQKAGRVRIRNYNPQYTDPQVLNWYAENICVAPFLKMMTQSDNNFTHVQICSLVI